KLANVDLLKPLASAHTNYLIIYFKEPCHTHCAAEVVYNTDYFDRRNHFQIKKSLHRKMQ
ncbi:hypothetical protein, partial [Marinomonas sp.]|uniref:hypothetical protein n=1 Tax=Marinomonas sp. TaxID=1904862 RepID=UPI003A938687